MAVRPRVIIVGSGLGGLNGAVRLAGAPLDVVVVGMAGRPVVRLRRRPALRWNPAAFRRRAPVAGEDPEGRAGRPLGRSPGAGRRAPGAGPETGCKKTF